MYCPVTKSSRVLGTVNTDYCVITAIYSLYLKYLKKYYYLMCSYIHIKFLYLNTITKQ